ncbi:T-box protein 12, partial [Taenia solium]
RPIYAIGNLIRGCIFPKLNVSIEGLKADGMYVFISDLMPRDCNVYSHYYALWFSCGSAEPYPPPNQATLIHELLEEFKWGSLIVASGVGFSLARITAEASTPIDENRAIHVGTHVIPETKFVTFDKYYNRCIAELKMDTNPNAKSI